MSAVEPGVAASDKPRALRAAYDHAAKAGECFAFGKPFHEVEVMLLRLAGLSEALAESHAVSAFRYFHAESWEHNLANSTLHEAVMQRVRRGRDAVCDYSTQLEVSEQERLTTVASRNRMRKVARVLGGVLIVGTNAARVADARARCGSCLGDGRRGSQLRRGHRNGLDSLREV